MNVLFPLNPLGSKPSADDHFSAQDALVRTLDDVDRVSYIDIDALTSGFGKPFRLMPTENAGVYVYRGWMLSVGEYAALEAALVQRGGSLLTSAEQYETAHHITGRYSSFADLTPVTWFLGADGWDALKSHPTFRLGDPECSFIVKDHVKSLKDEWETACFAKNLDALPQVIDNFIRIRGEYLQGGVVVRRFEDFDKTLGEARVWWVDGEPVLVTAHPDTPDLTPVPVLDHVYNAVEDLECPFVTTDMTLRSDGEWRVVEVGDGQVSDAPAGADMTPVFEALARL